MNFSETVRMLRLRLTTDQIRACHYLEHRGLRFCIDFGHANAIATAREDWLKRRRERYAQRKRGF